MTECSTRSGTPRRWRRIALSIIGSSFLATACASEVLPGGVTEQAAETESTWDTFVQLGLVIWALAWALIGWVLLRYRRRSDEIPDQRQYFNALEIFYTAVPVLLVAFLWYTSWQAEEQITDLSPDPDVEIVVVGFQWQWQFRYVEHGEVTDEFVINGAPGETPKMVVPVGQTVRLKLVADDVIHSFWVPEFLEKRDLIPEVDNEIDIDVTETGEWTGRCAEFCGLDHWKMKFTVEAVEGDDYSTWVSDQQAQAGAES